ncbi:MAG: hypothetical protein WEB57_12165 [Pseudohongiellaceae bacterium]
MKAHFWFLAAALLCVTIALYAATFHTEKLLDNGPLTWLVATSLLSAGLTGITLEIRSRHSE